MNIEISGLGIGKYLAETYCWRGHGQANRNHGMIKRISDMAIQLNA